MDNQMDAPDDADPTTEIQGGRYCGAYAEGEEVEEDCSRLGRCGSLVRRDEGQPPVAVLCSVSFQESGVDPPQFKVQR